MIQKGLSCIVIIVMVLSGLLFGVLLYAQREYNGVAERSSLVQEVVPLLDSLDSEMWGIVSVYDPAEARTVDVAEREQYVFLNRINDYLARAHALADAEDVAISIELIQRAVKTLAKRIDRLRGLVAMQKLDTQSTATFFKDSAQVSTLSESYVDDMQRLMERIRTIIKNAKIQINEHMQLEVRSFVQCNKGVKRIVNRWMYICAFVLFLVLIALVFLYVCL